MKFHEDNTQPINTNVVTEFEQKIGCVLPLDYRDFLIRHNGGQPEYQFLKASK